jgi:protein-tyrosine phosphatase
VKERTGVLFVCLGNICRSPLAEGIFIAKATRAGVIDRFDVDSCGTGAWHAGERADHRSLAVARIHGIELSKHRPSALPNSGPAAIRVADRDGPVQRS